jgi:uncharacterized protein (DUF1330 family)
MTVYGLVELEITNLDDIGPYLGAVGGTIADHGGKYLVRPGIEQLAGNAEVVEGGLDQYPVKVILEFPSMTKAKDWYNSAEYQAILPHRTNNANGRFVWLEGFNNPK